MKLAQITENFLVYLCKLPFLKKVRKKLKKSLDFSFLLRYNRQAHKTRVTSRVRKIAHWKLNNMKFRALKSAEISLIHFEKKKLKKVKKIASKKL